MISEKKRKVGSEEYEGPNQDETLCENEQNNSKKPRHFSGKEFRQRIKTDQCYMALQEFLRLCQEKPKQDCILDYLKSGGTCLELMQLLESNSGNVQHLLILEVTTHVILKVISSYHQYASDTQEAIRYLFNTYMALVNKMLNMSSSSKERKTMIKLLTAIATFSASFAKDILMNVKFHTDNIEILTVYSEEKDSVRNAFINFLLAFLVDGHFPTISLLLERKYLLTSIISGLKFDDVDVVCRVITALKNFILELPSISKTMKMKVFSTPVVKDIVNLYNWKGLKGYDPKKKEVKKYVEVDEHEKYKVNECVHEFLLLLCTSHRHGIIFRDRSLGLNKKSQNNLILTVLTHLENPWEHSYASELVSKICGACPDLAKTVWSNLKLFLEPRPTVKWLKAIEFAKLLLKELVPSCVEFCIKDFSPNHISQTIQMLAAPTSILKALLPEKNESETPITKYHVLSLLIEIIKTVNCYIESNDKWMTKENTEIVQNSLSSHIKKNFPNAKDILENWNDIKTDTNIPDGFEKVTTVDNLNAMFELFEYYKKLSPALVETLKTNINLLDFLNICDNHSDQTEEENLKIAKLTTNIINLFLEYNPDLFLPNSDIYSDLVYKILTSHHKKLNVDVDKAFVNMLKNTGIFDNCDSEIRCWTNGVFDLKHLDGNFLEFFIAVVKLAWKNLENYKEKIISFNTEVEPVFPNDNESILDASLIEVKPTREAFLSPLLLGVFDHLKNENAKNKYVKLYLNFVLTNIFHSQTDITSFVNLVNSEEYSQVVPTNLFNYIVSWTSDDIKPLEKTKGKVLVFANLSQAFLEGNSEKFLNENLDLFDEYKDLKLNTLQMLVFYVANLSKLEKMEKKHLKFALDICNNLLEKFDKKEDVFKCILGNPILLEFFSPPSMNKEIVEGFCTLFILQTIQKFKCTNESIMEEFVAPYRNKLFSTTKKLLKKACKGKEIQIDDSFVNVITIIDLDYEKCCNILKLLTKLSLETYIKDSCISSLYKILVYCIERISYLYLSTKTVEPLDETIIVDVSKILTYLNQQSNNYDTSALALAINNYINTFDGTISKLDKNVFVSILQKSEYCKENATLATNLFKNNHKLITVVCENVETACAKKGLILPLIDVAIKIETPKENLKKIYDTFEPSIVKTLQKPQKAGQHFEKHFEGVAELISNFMPESKYKQYYEKVHKFETTEVFHYTFLKVIFRKGILEQEKVNDKHLNNCLITFIHLLTGLFKKKIKAEDDWEKIEKTTNIFCSFLNELSKNSEIENMSFEPVVKNETFRTYCKFCLKFGVSEQNVLLVVMDLFVTLFDFKEEDASLLLEMLTSHSEFLEVLLSENHKCKFGVVNLFYRFCEQYPRLMVRNHVPIMLSAYNATLSRTDRIIYKLLKKYASAAGQTGFYDFKPFLWGKAAASHYSVRSQIQNVLWRQPRMADVMDILEESMVFYTIKNYPLACSFDDSYIIDQDPAVENEESAKNIYDLRFLYQIFNLLLSHENVVQNHKFTISGALSLTIIGLSCESEEVRAAAASILSRFYVHVEAKTRGKDNLLWLTFLNTIRSGLAAVPENKMNNFAAIFFSKMAMVLTQPQQILYGPLSQYLVAKKNPDISGIPELYTFLHSSDVNYKEYRSFILKVLRDGMRTEHDFQVASHCMVFKLIMELYTSNIADSETRHLILDVFKKASIIPAGAKILCSGYAMLSYIYITFSNLPSYDINLRKSFLEILNNIEKNVNDDNMLNNPFKKLLIASTSGNSKF